METVDLVAHYVYFLHVLLIGTAAFIIVSGVDDLFIDILYWARLVYRRVFLRLKIKPLEAEQLFIPAEKPFAIIVPAWHEDPVIEQMVDNTIESYEYIQFAIFIGVYQNDPKTHAAAKRACAKHDNVFIVTVPEDGPTCKADCLNWLLQGVMLHEQKHGMQFAGIVMHDAEDVVHRLELKLFNYLIDRKDMMQLPVFSLESPWYEFTAGHYIDEFAENHTKDLLVREMLTGEVPSAGVATCFSRRAIEALARHNNNQVFNTDTLTEDYDIGFRLNEVGMNAIFLRYGVMATIRKVSPFTGAVKTVRQLDYVATREYFPNSIRAAKRQKARWILGIVFQGWASIGWRGGLATRYILMRDRKAVFTAFATFIAYFLLFHIILLTLWPQIFPDAFMFPTLVEYGSLPWYMLMINLFMLANRIFHRMLFTGRIYGWEQAILSVPRMVIGNIVAFLASARALRLFIKHLITGKRLVWDKTDHAYPSMDQLAHMRQRLGDLLIERNLITEFALEEALERQKSNKRPLGELLLDMDVIALPELAGALAKHLGITTEEAMASLQKGNA